MIFYDWRGYRKTIITYHKNLRSIKYIYLYLHLFFPSKHQITIKENSFGKTLNMYTYKHPSSYKPYREVRIFSTSELLFMEIKALILFGETAKDWWKRLSPAEKYRILHLKEDSRAVKEVHGDNTMIQQV